MLTLVGAEVVADDAERSDGVGVDARVGVKVGVKVGVLVLVRAARGADVGAINTGGVRRDVLGRLRRGLRGSVRGGAPASVPGGVALVDSRGLCCAQSPRCFSAIHAGAPLAIAASGQLPRCIDTSVTLRHRPSEYATQYGSPDRPLAMTAQPDRQSMIRAPLSG
ncbi:hypothetical protein [Dietzia sp. ANT_WB102]|uniref:hypothetical protein n=1 Tax=Dietzia sp. ANT_WB102 TaxID=2597345 RepID=UPI0011EFB53A|nr:hypothetical protein [Dietzia sp. ANT_WB102]KAA0918509.1 hypothetical protein FQ137_03970 [Dietzia sp. ANT_WB102]